MLKMIATKYSMNPEFEIATHEKNTAMIVKRSVKKNSCGTIVGPIRE